MLRALLLVPAALLLSAAAAAAQSVSEEPRAGWTFRPSFTFGGAVDDNVLLVGDDTNPLLPTEYMTALTPAGQIDFRSQRLRFGALYLGSFVLYRELSELNSLDQTARAQIAYRASRRATFSFSQSFATARTTDTFDFVGVPFSRIGTRNSMTTAGLQFSASPRTMVNTGYNLRVVDFDDEGEDRVPFPGGHEHQFSGSVMHQLSPRLSAGGTYGLRRFIVTNQADVVMIHHAAGAAEYRLNETVDFEGSLGVSHLGAVAAGTIDELPSRTGLLFRGGLSLRREYFRVSGYYERSIVPSFGFGGTFDNEELSTSVEGAFARRRAYWQAGAAWRDNDPLEVVDPGPSRRTVWLSSRLGYRVSPWLRVEGYFSRARQDAQDGEGFVHRNRIGFEIVTSAPFRVAP